MSYSFNNPCWACAKAQDKENPCTDAQKMQDAINGIHSQPYGKGHLGCGQVMLMCTNLEQKILK